MQRKPTRADLARRVVELERQLAQVQAQLRAIQHAGTVPFDNQHRAVVVPLTREQLAAVRDGVEDQSYRQFGGGTWLTGSYAEGGTYQDVLHWDDLIPGLDGFLVRGHGHTVSGWCLQAIWGLKKVEG